MGAAESTFSRHSQVCIHTSVSIEVAEAPLGEGHTPSTVVENNCTCSSGSSGNARMPSPTPMARPFARTSKRRMTRRSDGRPWLHGVRRTRRHALSACWRRDAQGRRRQVSILTLPRVTLFEQRLSWACVFSSDGRGTYTYLTNGARRHSRWLRRRHDGIPVQREPLPPCRSPWQPPWPGAVDEAQGLRTQRTACGPSSPAAWSMPSQKSSPHA